MARKILIVDDESDLELLVQHKFRRRIASRELDFSFARDGLMALAVLESDPDIEVVITDINMPGMDGLTLLSKLGESTRLLRTVVVSAYDDLANIRIAMNRGAYDFLTKPIDFADFETTLDKTLRELDHLREGLAAKQQLDDLETELRLATRIQRSILPEVIQGRDEFEIGATMTPARQVSGDFYDFFLIDGNRLGLAIGDVSGKGIPAALFMAVSRTLLRATALRGLPPAECLSHVNHVLLRQNDGAVFLTLLYGILDLRTGDFEFSTGGHTPPYVWRPDGRGQFLREPRGMMLGVMEEAIYTSRSIRLSPGESLVFYTDGVTEAESIESGFFAESGLDAALNSIGDKSAAGIVAAIAEKVHAFSGAAEQSDDITVMAVRFRPAAAERNLPAAGFLSYEAQLLASSAGPLS